RAHPAAAVARPALRHLGAQPPARVRSAHELLPAGSAPCGPVSRMSDVRVLIVGGYGTFGGRLAQLLAHAARLTLILAAPARGKAEAFCARLPLQARREALAFDRDGDIAGALAAARPDVVVDASGPFQFYAADPYRLVKACLARGVDYLDLADGSAFVDGIARFDAAARARGVALLAGVSSFPVLTAAAVRRLLPGIAPVDRVRGG